MAIQPMQGDMNIVQKLVIPGLDEDLDVIQKLDDEPNDVGGLTSAQLKAEFDKAGNLVKGYINNTLLPAISDTVAEEEVRAQAEASRTEQEAARVAAEVLRVAAEEARAAVEAARVQAEADRAVAESGRETTEAQRVAAEEARVNVEALRVAAEVLRVAAENARVTAESGRVTAEQGRAAAEGQRTTAEGQRAAAETQRAGFELARTLAEEARVQVEAARVQAEGQRVTQEDTRQAQEAARSLAEGQRVTAEQGRAAAEQTREAQEDTRQTQETARNTAEEGREAAEGERVAQEEARSLWEPYDPAKGYVAGNKVAFNGSSYLCVAPCTGKAPTDTAYWLLIAAKGVDGEGAGDMLAGTYDPQGKAQDVFAYADDGRRVVHYRDCSTLTATDSLQGFFATCKATLDKGNEVFGEMGFVGGVTDCPAQVTTKSMVYIHQVAAGVYFVTLRCGDASPYEWFKLVGSVTASGAYVSLTEWAQGNGVGKADAGHTHTAGEVGARPSTWTPSASEVGAAVPAVNVNATLTAAGWSGAGPYTQVLAVTGLLAGQNGDVGLTQSATAAQREAARDAMLSVTGQAAGSLTITADGDKPTMDLPVSVTLLG